MKMCRAAAGCVFLALVVATEGRVFFPGGRASSAFVFPGANACTAPSGKPGDCTFDETCKSRGVDLGDVCGFDEQGTGRLLYCCERSSPASKPRRPRLGRPGISITGEVPASGELPAAGEMACGLRTGSLSQTGDNNIAKNIVAGHDAKVGAWPWAAILGVKSPGGGKIRWDCGGALIDDRHVLTAAHCIIDSDDIADVVVRLGEHNVTDPHETPTHQERGALRRRRHPQYTSLARKHDIAIIRLSRPVAFSAVVQPVCLPPPDARLVGRSGFVVGWGQLEPGRGGPLPDVIQEAIVSIIDTEECDSIHRRNAGHDMRYPGGLDDGTLCAVDPRDTPAGQLVMDACRGDSGGPFSVMDNRKGHFEVVGLVSAGAGCGDPRNPGIYARVAHYIDWIQDEVARN